MGNPALTPGSADWLGGRKAIALDAGGSYRLVLIGNEGQLVAVDYPHWEIHHGNHWSGYGRHDSLANDAAVDFMLVTGAKSPHILMQFTATANAWLDWFVNPTVTANGTKIKALSNNAASKRKPTAAIYKAPTVTDDGISAAQLVIPGGAKQSTVGGDASHGAEFILAPNTTYLFRVTNKGGAGVVASVGFSAEWYEEEPFVDG